MRSTAVLSLLAALLTGAAAHAPLTAQEQIQRSADSSVNQFDPLRGLRLSRGQHARIQRINSHHDSLAVRAKSQATSAQWEVAAVVPVERARRRASTQCLPLHSA